MDETSSNIHYTSDESMNMILNVLTKTDNVNFEKPYNTNYVTEQSRLESFKQWPIKLTQKPDDLAKAGFYYYGIKDIVKCFFCNGSLHNWDINDVPIEEHTRWFPKCSYIKQLMGVEYIEQIHEKYMNQDSGFVDYTSLSSSRRNSDVYNNQKERDISPSIVMARLDLPGVRKIMQLGFKINTVRRAIENKLKNDGDDFKNLVDLVSACFDIDDQDKALEKKLKELFHFVMFNASSTIKELNVYQLFYLKFNVKLANIKILTDAYNSTKKLIFVRLNEKDIDKLDTIIDELNNKSFSFNNNVENDKFLIKKMNNITIDALMPKSYDSKKLNDFEKAITQASSIIDYEQLVEAKNLINENTMLNERRTSINQLNQQNSIVNLDHDILVNEVEKLYKERDCVICLDRRKNIIFLPCAHLASCVECSMSMQCCPICRIKVQATIKTYC